MHHIYHNMATKIWFKESVNERETAKRMYRLSAHVHSSYAYVYCVYKISEYLILEHIRHGSFGIQKKY